MSEDYKPRDSRVTYNAAEEIKNNIVYYFKQASFCMITNNLYGWYKFLEQVYIEASFKFSEKEKNAMREIWKRINPHDTRCHTLLNKYHLELRQLCFEHDFFTPPKMDAGEAVFHR